MLERQADFLNYRSVDFLSFRTRGFSYITDKKENQIFLIYSEIQNEAVAKSYMTNGLPRYGEYIRKPILISDFATAPL